MVKLIILLVLSIDLFAWDQLLLLEEVGSTYSIVLDYDDIDKSVRVRYRSIESSGIYKDSPVFSVAGPSSVDSSLIEVKNLLKNSLQLNLESKEVRVLIERIEEFRYLSARECRALHIDKDELVPESKAIQNLVDQMEKVSQASSPSSDAFRSIHISTFETAEGPIQLRMVLDQNSDFLNFSFAKEQGSLSRFDWDVVEGVIRLRAPAGNTILEVDSRSFSSSEGLLIVKSLRPQRLEEEARSYIKLSKTDSSSSSSPVKKWAIKPYKNQHFVKSVIKSGIPLTTSIADHTPVIQLRDKEVTFKRLDASVLSQLDILERLSKANSSKLELFYNQCMGERLSFNDEEKDTRNDSKVCFRSAQLEGVGLALSNPQSVNLEFFKKCLKAEGIADKTSSFFSFDTTRLNDFSVKEFKNTLMSCYKEQKKIILVENFNKERLKLVSRASESSTNNAIATYQKNCLETADAKGIVDCGKYGDHLLEDELLTLKINEILNSKKGLGAELSENANKLIIEELKVCQEQRNTKALERFSKKNNIEEVISELKEDRIHCAKKIIVKLSTLVKKSFFTDAFRRAGLTRGSFAREESFDGAKEQLEICWSGFIEEEEELSNIVEDMDYHLEACLPEALRGVVKNILSSEFITLANKYPSLDSNDTSRGEMNLGKIVKQAIDKELTNWREIDQFKKIRDTLRPKIYSLIYNEHVEGLLKGFPNSKRKSKLELKKIANRGINSSGDNAVVENGRKFFLSSTNSQKKSGEVVLKESLKHLYISSADLISNRDVNLIRGKKNPESFSTIAIKGSDSFTNCFENYTPNSAEGFQSSLLNCEKKRIAKIRLLTAFRENEEYVSGYLPLSSNKANKVLTVNQYLGQCAKRVDKYGTLSLGEYGQYLDNCIKLSKYDIATSISLAQVDSFSGISQLKEDRARQVTLCFADALAGNSDLPVNDREALVRISEDARKRSVLGGSMLGLLPGAQISKGQYSLESSNILEKLISGGLFENNDREAEFKTQMEECKEQVSSVIRGEFRGFVMRSIPSLDLNDTEDDNVKLMENFLDVELVELILDFQRVNESKITGRRVQIKAGPLSNRLITSDLGLDMLVNFIDLLGELINKGLVYDSDAMKTELVVFQSELKGFLKWYTTNPDLISIEETYDFFKSSKLAEHLSMAVVSEKVYESFLIGISQMKKRELNYIFSGKKCFDSERCLSKKEAKQYQALNNRFDDLRKLSLKMTSSFDFRRIIRPETKQGKEIINSVRDNYLMPKVMGTRVNATAEESMMTLIGNSILEDNTDGGFADEYVHIIAQAQLDIEKGRRWGITKWLLFDDLDFDWDRLKETSAGLKAINYYSRFIMLPEALGKPLLKYELKLRMNRFAVLISLAQSQNKL